MQTITTMNKKHSFKSQIAYGLCIIIICTLTQAWVCLSTSAQDERLDKKDLSSIVRMLISKQNEIRSFHGILMTTNLYQLSKSDEVIFSADENRMLLREIQGTMEEEISLRRGIRSTSYFDGSNYWMEVGNLIVRSKMAKSQVADTPFLRLDSLSLSNLIVVRTNAPDAVIVLERQIKNPEIQVMMGIFDIQELREKMEASSKTATTGTERLWFRTDNGFCFEREEYDVDGLLVRKRTYTDLKFNSTYVQEVFQPKTSGKQVIETAWPYSQEIQSKIINESAHFSHALGDFRAVIRVHSDVAGLQLIKLLDDSWHEHDLSGFGVQTEENEDEPVSLLARATYCLLVKSDDEEVKKKLTQANQLPGLQALPSYAIFKKALKDAGDVIPKGQDRKARAQFLFETYKDEFPLRGLIKKVGEEFQLAHDQHVDSAAQPPMRKLQVFVECRGNEVFCVNRPELEKQLMHFLDNQKPPDGKDDATMKVLQSKDVGDSVYSIDLQQFFQQMKICLRPRPGVHGDGIADFDRPTSPFRHLLRELDRTGTTITFLVRPDSAEVFQKAHQLAEANAISSDSISLGKDEPIVLPSQSGQ